MCDNLNVIKIFSLKDSQSDLLQRVIMEILDKTINHDITMHTHVRIYS